jgi:hypothetical protein
VSVECLAKMRLGSPWCFKNGKHQGQPIGTLLQELREGRLTPSGIPMVGGSLIPFFKAQIH